MSDVKGPGPPGQTPSRRALLGGVAASACTLVLTACSSTDSTAQPSHSGTMAGGLPSPHVHGVARDPGDGKVYVATHAGLFRYDDAGPVRVGPVVDLMGFTVAVPGRLLASGHPGAGVDLPHPVGLVESTDGGNTWQVRSRAGESDFHALTASPAGVLGFDGVLRSSVDGQTWRDLSIPAEPRVLAASPDGARVLATTADGVLASLDYGVTWSPVDRAPLLLLAAWADPSTAIGVATDGRLHLSRDHGRTWVPRNGRVSDVPQALTASLYRGRPEVLVVDGRGITRSQDLGDSLVPFPAAA